MKTIKETAKEIFPMESGNVQINSYQSERRRAFIQGYEYKNENITFEDAVEAVMKYLSDNNHPHTMIQIDSTSAQLWEGQKSHLTTKFVKD